jgi:hypothetical protein
VPALVLLVEVLKEEGFGEGIRKRNLEKERKVIR